MEINRSSLTLADVPIGEKFLYENELFMRITPIRVSDTEAYNVISLETGKVAEMSLCRSVRLGIIKIDARY